jgi:glutamate 5-kinase
MKIILKIGTNVLVNNKNCLDLVLMQNLVQEISRVYNQNHQIIIITSGAVATGREMAQSNQLFRSALAALGQAKLIKYYHDFFSQQGIQIAQVLLSANSFKNRPRFNLLKETLLQLASNRIIPIINENDTTVLKDTFGDNDFLAAIIAVLVDAQKLVFLTDLDGLYSSDPKIDKNARIIQEVKSVDLEIQRMCSKETSSLGRGGMFSKLKGAKLATTCEIETFIVSGLKSDNIMIKKRLRIKKFNRNSVFCAKK